LSSELVEYLTSYTDYIANKKIPIKDTAIIRLFIEPFKWDFIQIDRAKLGKADMLLTECLKSDDFW